MTISGDRLPRIAGAALCAWITFSMAAGQAPSPAPIQAGRESTSLTLRIVDMSDAVIAGAQVTLMNQENHFQIKQTSNQEGKVNFRGIPTGFYNILVTAQGFRTNEIAFTVNKPFERPIRLQIASGSSADIMPVSNAKESATLTVLVVDQVGAILVTAVVTLMDEGNHIQGKLTTNHEGKVSFLAVPAGSYRISVSASGFKTSEQSVRIETQPIAIKIALPVETSVVFSGPLPVEPIPLEEPVITPEIAPYPIQPLPQSTRKKDQKELNR